MIAAEVRTRMAVELLLYGLPYLPIGFRCAPVRMPERAAANDAP